MINSQRMDKLVEGFSSYIIEIIIIVKHKASETCSQRVPIRLGSVNVEYFFDW